MKLTGILLLVATFQVNARSMAQTVTYTAEATPLIKVFPAIERQTGYVFFYDKQDLNGAVPVTVRLESAPLKTALERIFTGQPLVFDIQGNTIVITKREKSDTTSGMPMDPGGVHGHVTDSLGNPLAGVSVTIKGNKGVSTVTDPHGDFMIVNVNGNVTLSVSSIGYETEEVKLKGRSNILVKLRAHSTTLLDVVVNKGYYSTSQRLNTGDVTKISGDDISKQPVSDPILALEGRVPGLYIQQTSGVPGSYSSIKIRGQNSLQNSNDPLYVVDGVPFSSVSLTSTVIGGGILGQPINEISNAGGLGMSPFNSLNPGDIETIEVLKDADATAIYGSRGSNGVVLITTKKGKAGQAHVDINLNAGEGKTTRMLPLLNTTQYLEMRKEAFQNDGIGPQPYDYDVNGVWDTTRYTNWAKTLIGKASAYTNAQASISGGNINTQYLVSGSYNDQGVVFPGDYADRRATGHVSITNKSENQHFNLQFSSSYSSDNSNLPQSDPTGQIILPPDAPPLYDKNGNLNWQPLGGTATWINPLSYTVEHAKAVTTSLKSNLVLGYVIFPGLQLKSSFGYNESEMNQSILVPATYVAPPNNNVAVNRSNSYATTTSKVWDVEPQLNYQRKIGKGQLSALLGMTYQQTVRNSIAQLAYGFASDALISDPMAASYNFVEGTSNSLDRYNALFGGINYNWEEKYLLNITARRDGSSRFGPGKQFGNFGAAGIGWIFSKENFIQDALPFLSFGKIRGSYGITGNDGIGDYIFLNTYLPVGVTYQGLGGMISTGLENPTLSWELDKKLEGGMELGFMKDRIVFTGSYFRNRTNNQLIGYSLPYIAGFNHVEANFPATLQNTGVELTLNSMNLNAGLFTWHTSINATFPQNKLVAFPGLETSAYQYFYAVGHAISSSYMFHYTGVDPKTGSYIFASKDGSGVPSYPQDLVISKPITQQYTGGIRNSLSFKGFQLDILFQFVKQTGRSYQQNFPMAGTLANQPVYVLSRWQRPGQEANIQQFSSGEENNAANIAFSNLQISDGTITDASFIRLKTLYLSYSLPAAQIKKIHMQNATLYVSCQNMFTITSYKGIDPETGGIGLPPLRMMTGGIQLAF